MCVSLGVRGSGVDCLILEAHQNAGKDVHLLMSVYSETAFKASNLLSPLLPALDADLLLNRHINCPDPPTLPMLSEKQADTFYQQ